MTFFEIPACPECGSQSWSRVLEPRVETFSETISYEEGEPTYRTTWIDEQTGMAWQDNIVASEWTCNEGHLLDYEDLVSYDLEELTNDLDAKGGGR